MESADQRAGLDVFQGAGQEAQTMAEIDETIVQDEVVDEEA